MREKKIEPKISLTIYLLFNCICYIIRDNSNNILYIDTQDYSIGFNSYYPIRKTAISKVKNIIQNYQPDTIILEQTKMFTDGITKYPDPEVYKNIILKYGLQISMEDNFLDMVQYFIEIPYYDWTQTILNSKFKYILDRCMNHIINNNNLTEEQLNSVKQFNLYQALCFSECVNHNKLMNKKYLIR